MPDGFFPSSKLQIKNPSALRAPKCGTCGLHQTCLSPQMPPTGNGRQGILIIAEAPGRDEDRRGTQLIGQAGQYLRRCLRGLGVDLDRDCWKTNAVCCRPSENATPTNDQILACRPLVFKAINKYKPHVIMLLGKSAVQSVIGQLWKEDVGDLGRWIGYTIPNQKPNVWIVPTWHPSYLERENSPVLNLLFRRHLKKAIGLGKDHVVHEDLAKKVHVETDPTNAARHIKWTRQQRIPFVFDYETNCLKPETKGARILSCAISNGDRIIAYPWIEPAIEQTRRLLQSDIPKIAANAKFEERWSRLHAGGPVKNWLWCTMVAAHVLDNRRGTTGLKFQAYTRLGVGSYDDQIKPYMEPQKNGLNRLNKVHIADLLLYNGMDALLTWELAQVQIKMIDRHK